MSLPIQDRIGVIPLEDPVLVGAIAEITPAELVASDSRESMFRVAPNYHFESDWTAGAPNSSSAPFKLNPLNPYPIL